MKYQHAFGQAGRDVFSLIERLEPRLLMSGSLSIVDSIGNASDRAVSLSDTVLGASSTAATFSLTNTGDAAVNISGFSAPGIGSDFDVTVLDNASQVVSGNVFAIAPGETYTVQVVFNPVGTTGDKAAAITFASDDPGNANVSLSASGKALTLGASDALHVIEVARPVIGGVQYVTYDLLISSTTDWTMAQLWVDLSSGSIYQNTSAGTSRDPMFGSEINDAPPWPNDLLVDPDVRWDTYMAVPDGSLPLFIFGSHTISSQHADVVWYTMVENGAISDVHIARVTVTADASGSLWGYWSNDATAGVGINFYSTIPLENNPALTVDSDDGGTSLHFDDVLWGGPGLTKTFTLTNTGASALNITSFAESEDGNPGDFSVVVKNSLGQIVPSQNWANGFEIGPASSYSVEVTFTPHARGNRTGSITFHTNDNNNESITLTFDGVGAAPSLSVTDSEYIATDKAIEFPATIVGRTSDLHTFTLANTNASQALSITNLVKAGGNGGDFTMTVKDADGNVVAGDDFVIAAGESYTIEVAFAPTAAGNRAGNIAFNTDDPQNAAVLLTFTGSANSGGRAQVTDTSGTTTDLTISFAQPVLVGATSSISRFTITNAGDLDLDITDFAKTADGNPGDFNVVIKDNLGNVVATDHFTISAGKSYKVEVTFRPTAAGARSASIVFNTSDAAHGSITLSMNGTANSGPALSVGDESGNASDLAVAFAQTAVGATSAVSTFTLSNTGDRPLNVTNFVKTLSAMSGDFRIVVRSNTGSVVSNSSFIVPVGEAFTVEVTFAPSEVGQRSGSITFNTNDAENSSVTLNFAGIGGEGSAGLFGNVGLSKPAKLILTDSDGTIVTFSLSGLGTGEVIKTLDGWQVVYTGTSAKSTATISTKKSKLIGDDGKASIDSITVEGAIKSISAGSVNLTGNFTVDDSLGTLTLGNAADGVFDIGGRLEGDIKTTLAVTMGQVSNVSFTSLTPMASLTVTNWLDSGEADVISAPSLGKLSTKVNKKLAIAENGDFQAGLDLTGDGVLAGKNTLGSASIGGRLGEALWDITGSAGNITVRGAASASTLRTTLGMASLSFGGMDTVNILAGIDGSMLEHASQAEDITAGIAIKSITTSTWVSSHASAATIGSVKLTGGSFAADQTMIHVLNNSATPRIAPIKTIKTTNLAWNYSIVPGLSVLEIL